MPIVHISCAPSAHVGEQIARDFLLTRLSNSYGILLTNYHHPAGNGTEEHDLVLINERGVWTLEVKHWVGNIEADKVYWLHNGYRHPSPVTSIEIKAKNLASNLRGAGFTNISVVGLVVLTRSDVRLKITDPLSRKVFHLNTHLLGALTGRNYLYRPSNMGLSATLIDRIADTLVHRKVDPGHTIVASYRLLRELETREGVHVYEAQHINIPSRHARVKKYHLTNYTSAEELQEAARRFQQDMQALTQVDAHPNIIRAYDFLIDPDSDDTYWLLLEWTEGVKLQDRLDEGRHFSLDEQLDILRQLTGVISYCHSKGILHRNLNPSSVYLADNGKVKLGDFDFARVPDLSKTISKTGTPLIVNKYTAPELKVDARMADVRSDLYSLGAIWYDMLTHRKTDEPVLLSRIKEVGLSDQAEQLLRSLLASRPEDRPNSAEEVKNWLRQI